MKVASPLISIAVLRPSQGRAAMVINYRHQQTCCYKSFIRHSHLGLSRSAPPAPQQLEFLQNKVKKVSNNDISALPHPRAEVGLGLFTRRPFKAGETLFEEEPYAAVRKFGTQDWVCSLCLRNRVAFADCFSADSKWQHDRKLADLSKRLELEFTKQSQCSCAAGSKTRASIGGLFEREEFQKRLKYYGSMKMARLLEQNSASESDGFKDNVTMLSLLARIYSALLDSFVLHRQHDSTFPAIFDSSGSFRSMSNEQALETTLLPFRSIAARPFELSFLTSSFPPVPSIEDDLDLLASLFEPFLIELANSKMTPLEATVHIDLLAFVEHLFTYQTYAAIYLKVNLNYIRLHVASPIVTFLTAPDWRAYSERVTSPDVVSVFQEALVDADTKLLNASGFGLFFASSMMNHHCRPSVVAAVPNERATAKWVASRDLAQDEELTIAYVDPAMPFDERQRYLQSKHYFRCPCSTDCMT